MESHRAAVAATVQAAIVAPMLDLLEQGLLRVQALRSEIQVAAQVFHDAVPGA